jgi:hypothetical protein
VGIQTRANPAPDGGKLLQAGAFADIDHERCMADGTRIADEIGKGRNQVDREVVDGIVAKILEGSKYRGLTGTAQPGDDDQFRAGSGGARRLRFSGLAFTRLFTVRARQTRSPAGRKSRVCRRAISRGL